MRIIVILLLALIVAVAMSTRPDESAHMARLDAAGPEAVQNVVEDEFGMRLPDAAADAAWRTLRGRLDWTYSDRYLFSTLAAQDDDERTLVSVGLFNTVFLLGDPEAWLSEQLDTLRDRGLLNSQ